jgi:ATP adenylyltransferase
VSCLERIWAGWREGFVSGAAERRAAPGGLAQSGLAAAPRGNRPAECVFCHILSSGLSDEEAHIVWRDPSGRVVALLNAYPYTSGHLMALPTRHVGELEDLTPEEAGDLWAAVTRAVRAIKAAYKPDGLNLGANLGRVAGAGVPGHFHVHVLPRWIGDTNFMTAVADARVLPEPLSGTAAKLRAAWPA